jgi:predicted Zn-dependent peptidase
LGGDATLLRTELEHYLAVTNDDIKRVAAQYLVEANRTELLVEPGAAAPATASAGETP